MFYYLYQITNVNNGKIYIGVHKTKNLKDGYMGSGGRRFQDAVKHHGIKSFKKEILEYFSTEEQMFAREKEIVTESFLLREDVYNQKLGGVGGWDHIPQHIRKQNALAINNGSNEHISRCQRAGKLVKNRAVKKGVKPGWFNDGLGANNSQFGTMWITNGIDNKKIKATDNIPEGWNKGRIIKVKNNG